MSTNPCQLTIGIPTLNRLGYLQELIGTLNAQVPRTFEILVSQDGDSADLREWCQSNAGQMSFRYQCNYQRLGLAGNWNEIVKSASGEYTLILGDDDRLEPNFVAEMLSACQSAPDVVFCDQFIIDENGHRLDEETELLNQRYGRQNLKPGLVADPLRLAWTNSIPMSASLIKTDLLRRHLFNPQLNTPETEFFARALTPESRLIYVPRRLMDFRVHQQSATTGGLWVDRFADAMIRISVPPYLEEAKRDLLRPLIIAGLSQCLTRGDRTLARTLLNSGYAPHTLATAYYRALVTMPTTWGRTAHAAFSRFVRAQRETSLRLRDGAPRNPQLQQN